VVTSDGRIDQLSAPRSLPANNEFFLVWQYCHTRNYAKLRIMRSPVPNFPRTNHFQGSGLRIISKAVKELHQLIRSSVPREVGYGRLQLTQGAFLH
jgi:hypothetical protein